MKKPARDLTGKTIGGWFVLRRNDTRAGQNTNWDCRCLGCGMVQTHQASNLRPTSKGCRSCATKRHGKSRTRIHNIWATMIARCTNPTSDEFERYGGRGIAVCERWEIFENFLADMGEPPSGMTLERKNNDLSYSPANCVWASRKAQARNRRSNHKLVAFGRCQCLAEWAEEFNIGQGCLWKRLFLYKWPAEEALTRPVRQRR
jgi:hypothetical protein